MNRPPPAYQLKVVPSDAARSYTTAEETCESFRVDLPGLKDLIARGLIAPPSRYIRGNPEWDKRSQWQGISREGTVYLAGFGQYVKIGFTSGTQIEYRIQEIQVGCPEKIEMLCAIPGSFKMEAALHRRFKELRLHGEWFRREGDLAVWIDEGCK